MSFGGVMSFGLEINARDNTQSALSSAKNAIAALSHAATKPITIPIRIGQGVAATLRDFNLGIAPLIRGLDNLIDRGSGLEGIQKTFRTSLDVGVKAGESIAKALQNASFQTLSLSES